MPDPSSFSLPPEDRARMLAAMAGAIDGGFWTSPDGNSGGSPGEIATAMLCALEPLLAARWDGLKEACRREMAHHFALPDAELAAERDQARAEARGLREALEKYGRHDQLCPIAIGPKWGTECTCGFDAALSASPDTEVRGHGRDRHGVLAPGRVVGVGPDPCPVPDEDAEPVSVPEQEEGREPDGWEGVRLPAEVAESLSASYRERAASSSSSEEGERAAPGVWHKDGPLGQVRWMAAWAEGMADPAGGNPYWENARKIAANLLAAADALEAERAALRKRLTSDEAVEAGAAVLRERFERWGVTGHGRDTTRDLLAAVADRLENRTETEGV